MCTTGNCPVVNFSNICVFPSDNSPADSSQPFWAQIPNSCLQNTFGSDTSAYNSYYNSLAPGLCATIGNGEWQPIRGTDYVNMLTLNYESKDNQPGPGKYSPSPNLAENSIFYGACFKSPCDSFSGSYAPYTQSGGKLLGQQAIDYMQNPTECISSDWTTSPYPILEHQFENYDLDGVSAMLICEKVPDGGKAYIGKHINCCLQNLFCDVSNTDQNDPLVRDSNRYNNRCFDTNTVSRTSGSCPFDYRRTGSFECFNTLFPFCTSGTSTDIGNKWTSDYQIDTTDPLQKYSSFSPCSNFFFSTMFAEIDAQSGSTVPGKECYTGYLDLLNNDEMALLPQPGISNMRRAQNILQTAVTNYISGGGDLAAPEGTAGSSYQFNVFVKKICTNYPGICGNFLSSYCESVTQDDLVKNPTLTEYCGCYLSDNVYSLYTDTFQINKECTPYCNLTGVIPLAKGVTQHGGKVCQQSTCVINNVSLSFVNSEVTGEGLNIGNFCGSCSQENGPGVCNCVMDNLTFRSINSQINDINLTQECTSGICFATDTDANGNRVKRQIPCDVQIEEARDLPTVDVKQTITQVVSIVAVIVLALAVVLLIYFILSPNTGIEGEPLVRYAPDIPQPFTKPYTSIINVLK